MAKVGSAFSDRKEGENEVVYNLDRPISDEDQEALKALGYHYDERGVLKHIETGEYFKFVNQAHYDSMGLAIVDFIQRVMVRDYGLQEVWLPMDRAEEKLVNIFHSPDVLSNPNVLCLVIQGSGAVRPGQWARSLCFNNSLGSGSILPYLHRIAQRGWATLVLNPNQNDIKNSSEKIPGHERPQLHTVTVFDEFVRGAAARDIVIIAHSNGGVCSVALLQMRGEQLQDRLKAIAFTDSVHVLPKMANNFTRSMLAEHTRNWASSHKPLDTPLGIREGCSAVSAGHHEHVYTSAACMESVFAYLDQKLTPQ